MKIRTLSEFQDTLDSEMGWRLKELSVFQLGARSIGSQRKPLIRAGVALLYAHWEGFIKTASEAYLSFVECRGHTYAELQTCFVLFGVKGKVDLLVNSKKSEANLRALEFILNELSNPVSFRMNSAVKTESNLTSAVFSNIAGALNISTAAYETKYNLIDSSLVERRNRIAHGDYFELDGREFGDLAEEVIGLMRSYKTDLENSASLKRYLK
jgi:MAE_28990/MAE_18760-like HEPN